MAFESDQRTISIRQRKYAELVSAKYDKRRPTSCRTSPFCSFGFYAVDGVSGQQSAEVSSVSVVVQVGKFKFCTAAACVILVTQHINQPPRTTLKATK
jgi:hypothetical protein